jgi:hypothetical protein
MFDWNALPEEQQITIAAEALARAGEVLARQAEVLAGEIDLGHLADRGGAEALRLFAAVARSTSQGGGPPEVCRRHPAGHA